MAQLSSDVTVPTGTALERVQNFLCEMLKSRLPELEEVRAVGHPWPAELDPLAVPWRPRTRNRLLNARLLEQLDGLADVTFGELARIPQMGPVGILDFLATLEASEQPLDARVFPPPLPEDSEAPVQVFEPGSAEAVLEALDEDWIDKVSADDPRFADLLPAIRGTLFETIDALTSAVHTGTEGFRLLDAIADAIPKVRARAQRIRGQPIEQALGDLARALLGRDDKCVDSVVLRLHWSGAPTRYTLDEAGRLAGVTRERIRQLEQRAKNRLAVRRFYLPQADQAMRLLADRAPLEPCDAARLLQEYGISSAPFHPRSLLSVAAALRLTPLVQLERRKGREAVVREPISAQADKVIEVAFRQLAQVGTTNVAEVTSELETLGVLVPEGEIVEVLRLYAGAEFTNESWFWCPGRPNCNLVTQANKMLSVVSPMNVGTLREGMKRAMRFRRSSGRRRESLVVPTKVALLEYFRRHPDFVATPEGVVRYGRPLDYRKELPASEQIMVRVLAETPSGVLDRPSLQDACVARGLNRNTFAILTTYSPILESLGYGLWKLRGRQVDPAAVEALRQLSSERPRERRVVDYGWKSDGRLWVAIRLPEDPTSVLPHVPSAIGRYLVAQEYVARTTAGTDCGRIRIYENGNSFGYAPFLRQAGADEGDILLAEFDLVLATAVLSLVDDDQLVQLAGAA